MEADSTLFSRWCPLACSLMMVGSCLSSCSVQREMTKERKAREAQQKDIEAIRAEHQILIGRK